MEQSNPTHPLLSIAIATRNRIPYAISAIQSILEIPDPRLELVVQDNSDSRELESYVHQNIKDNRFRYRYTPPPFSSIDNFNAAVELAGGEYICLIGDDDGVNPEIMEAASWAEANGVDVLSVKHPVDYKWPNFDSIRILGVLYYTPLSYSINCTAPITELKRLLANGGQGYQGYDLPKLYHGLVRLDCLKKVQKSLGRYFGGLSPDIYSVAILSLFAERILTTDYPLTITGEYSGAGTAYGKLRIRLEDTHLMRGRGDYQWSLLVPRFYCVETVWADSLVAALTDAGRSDLVRLFNTHKLHAYCLWRYPKDRHLILKSLLQASKIQDNSCLRGIIRFLVVIANLATNYFATRIMSYMKTAAPAESEYHGIPSTVEATALLQRLLKEKEVTFAAVAKEFKS